MISGKIEHSAGSTTVMDGGNAGCSGRFKLAIEAAVRFGAGNLYHSEVEWRVAYNI